VLDVDLDAVARQRLGGLAGDLEVARAQGIGLARDDEERSQLPATVS
jgi:hypothetical protein